eukprot:8693284-Heterocapsa_arctica.AAC.1
MQELAEVTFPLGQSAHLDLNVEVLDLVEVGRDIKQRHHRLKRELPLEPVVVAAVELLWPS